jgi:hypothetical protein
VFAAPYRTSEGVATVVVSVETSPGTLGLTAQTRRYERPLEVTWAATDAAGAMRSGDLYDRTLDLDAASLETASRYGVRILSQFDLPPGQYRLRVTVRSARTESIVTSLEVPEFGEPLSIGGVTLASLSSPQAATFVSGSTRFTIPLSPTSRREFETGETIGLFTEAYESRLRLEKSPARGATADLGAAGDHTTHLVLELRDEDGSILQTVAASHSMDRRRAGSHSFVARLSLDVPPGRYVIRLNAAANIGDPDTATRDVQIRVKPHASARQPARLSSIRA